MDGHKFNHTGHDINVQLSNSGPINSLTLDDVTIDGDSPLPPVPTPGMIDLTVNTSQLQKLCSKISCDIQVKLISPTSEDIDTIHVNPKTQSSVTGKYDNLLPGEYTVMVVPVSVPKDPSGGSVTYTYIPTAQISVNPNKVSINSVDFAYSAPTPQTGIAISLNKVVEAQTFKNIGLISGQVTDKNSSLEYPFQVGFESKAIIKNLPADHLYTVHIQGIADPRSGVYYSAKDIDNLKPVADSISNVNITYAKVSNAELAIANFNVSGAPSQQKVTFGSNNQKYRYNVNKYYIYQT